MALVQIHFEWHRRIKNVFFDITTRKHLTILNGQAKSRLYEAIHKPEDHADQHLKRNAAPKYKPTNLKSIDISATTSPNVFQKPFYPNKKSSTLPFFLVTSWRVPTIAEFFVGVLNKKCIRSQRGKVLPEKYCLYLTIGIEGVTRNPSSICSRITSNNWLMVSAAHILCTLVFLSKAMYSNELCSRGNKSSGLV